MADPILDRHLELDERVALRPEPFGALAYHFGNRRLIFLRTPEIVDVVRALAHHATVTETLEACGIAPDRWPSFARALASLEASELVREPVRPR